MLLSFFKRPLRTAAACLFAFFIMLPASAVDDERILNRRPAKLLSDYGFFDDLKAQKPAADVVPYDLTVPLYTDYAEKYRFVYVPGGAVANYHDVEAFEFPLGSALIKTFAYPADFRKPEENILLVETRVLLRQQKGWNAWTYVWNEDQTEATLKVAGTMKEVTFLDGEGVSQTINYIVPNKNQCKGCHSFNGDFTPIGPKARNLNKDFAYSSGPANQLAHWAKVGILSGAPSEDSAPKVPAIEDQSASLDARARAYLDINCAHCHRAEGPASTSGLFLTYLEQNKTTWGYKKRPVAAGRGSGGFLYDVAPGDAAQSIIYHRMQSVDPAVMMPEVGRTTAHAEGLALIRDWINAMK